MNIAVFTIFPDLIKNYCDKALLGKTLNSGLWNLKIVNIRDYAMDIKNKVDNTPYGGKSGMVMKPNIIVNAIDSNYDSSNTKFFYMSPKGKHINQQIIKDTLKFENIAILCGRY